MTITPMTIYWITRLDEVKSFLGSAALFMLMTGGFTAFVLAMTFEEMGLKEYPKMILFVPAVGILAAIMNLFVPTQKEMAAIYVIPMVVNNQKVQEIPGKLLRLADEWMNELRPKEK